MQLSVPRWTGGGGLEIWGINGRSKFNRHLRRDTCLGAFPPCIKVGRENEDGLQRVRRNRDHEMGVREAGRVRSEGQACMVKRGYRL